MRQILSSIILLLLPQLAYSSDFVNGAQAHVFLVEDYDSLALPLDPAASLVMNGQSPYVMDMFSW